MRIMIVVPIFITILGMGTLLVSFLSDLSEDEPISLTENSNITSILSLDDKLKEEEKDIKSSAYADSNKWIASFEDYKKKDFFYPVTEVSINMPLDKVYKTITVYYIETEQLEPYQNFCVSQVINKFRVNYTMKEAKEKIKFFIYTQNNQTAEKIIEQLKFYDIKAVLKKRIQEEER